MKRKFAIGCLCLSLLACADPKADPDEQTIMLEAGTGVVKATITTVKIGKGPVYCALHIDDEYFPAASPIIGGQRVMAADTSAVLCEFTGLPARTYAISVYQDENSNGEIDYNVFGAPTEGYGASNNRLPATSAANFDDSSFDVAVGQIVTLDIKMKN